MAGLICGNCGTENPEGARFCMECAAPFARGCPSCGAATPTGARFCMECGTALDDAPAASSRVAVPAAPVADEAPPEERRIVTILFADLAGYTAVSERMDPEAVKGLVQRALQRLTREVERFGGRVDKYIGDNVMAIFGAPVAHEDDPERAVRAALAMQGAMQEINDELERQHDVTFQLRVGVNTGEVVAGAVGDGYTVIGDAVNVASRLQSAGAKGMVTVGERTYRATRDAFDYVPLEPLELKGKAEPVPAYEAVGVVAGQAGRGGERPLAPFVGRDEELALLESLYGRVVRESRPHLVTLIGQAGVGKSRFLHELESHFAEGTQPPTVRHGRCLAYGAGIVYWALGEVIRTEAGILETDSSEDAWTKLAACVETLLRESGQERGAASERTAAQVARVLNIDVPDEVASEENDDPQEARERFFSGVRSCIEAMAHRGPLVLALEDIHWADDGMLDLIEYLAQWVRGPMLVLCLARDDLLERRAAWGGSRRSASSIFLEPLTEAETAELVGALLAGPGGNGGASDGHADLVPAVVERAGGNPFFAEEMVRRIEEEGAEHASELPETVQGLLAARLDSLEPFERKLVQEAAVAGRVFWESQLVPLAAAEGRDLGQALVALQEKEIVVPGPGTGLANERELAFKHVLIRDVAYGMLPKAVRCQRHFHVGQFIEERAGDRSDEVVALLAEHYGRAAALGEEVALSADELGPMQVKAIDFLERAGDAAASLYSNREAFLHYQAALQLRSSLDHEAAARIGEKQGDVALRMGRVDAALETWESCLAYQSEQDNAVRAADLHRRIGAGLWHKGERTRAIEHYQRGIGLLKDGEPCLELVHLYEEAASLYLHTGENMLAIYASERALRLAEELAETRAASRAHGIFGRVFGRIGDSEKARENLEKSVDLARESSPAETIRALLALGYHLEVSEADYDGAADSYREGLMIAEEVGDLPAQVELQAALALLAAFGADWETVERATEASAGLAEQEGLVGKLCFPYGLRGLLRWRAGDWEGAERYFRRAHELAEQVGWSEISFSSLFGLAMTLRDRGDHPGAIAALDQALDVCERAGLIAQSIQATGARAVTLALAGQDQAAREAAEEAKQLADRLHYVVGRAAALEAEGATAVDPGQGVELLQQSKALWEELGRPGDAARCQALVGWVLRDHDVGASQAALDQAMADFERLGVPHTLATVREVPAS